MKRIFISYKQDDAKLWALPLRKELAAAFGTEHVFLDKDTLHAGSWCDVIQNPLDGCRVVGSSSAATGLKSRNLFGLRSLNAIFIGSP